MCHIINKETRLNGSTTKMTTPTTDKKAPGQKRVCFREEVEVLATVPPCWRMSEEEQNDIWYSTAELNQFKETAKRLCLDLYNPKTPNVVPPNDDEDNCVRGMERYFSLDRQRRKILAVRVILKAQERFANPEQLAFVAEQCSLRAKEVARVAGITDALATVSLPTTAVPQAAELSCQKLKPPVVPQKRTLIEEPRRNVRRRVTPPPKTDDVPLEKWITAP